MIQYYYFFHFGLLWGILITLLLAGSPSDNAPEADRPGRTTAILDF